MLTREALGALLDSVNEEHAKLEALSDGPEGFQISDLAYLRQALRDVLNVLDAGAAGGLRSTIKAAYDATDELFWHGRDDEIRAAVSPRFAQSIRAVLAVRAELGSAADSPDGPVN